MASIFIVNTSTKIIGCYMTHLILGLLIDVVLYHTALPFSKNFTVILYTFCPEGSS